MCLLITGKSAALRSALLDTHGLIADIYSSNPDGLGIMYATSKGLKVSKILPKTAAEAAEFVARLPQDDRELAMHWRWRTHGNINMEQCHPYAIKPGEIALMHNGVLATGNKKDTTKSDTWHFIEDWLKGAATDTLHDPSFVKMLGEFIGDNRFAIMSGDGRLTVVNRDQGVEHDGLWFSNTYAWSPEKLIPGYATRHYRGNYRGNYGGWAFDGRELLGYDEDYSRATNASVVSQYGGNDTAFDSFSAESVFCAIEEYDSETLADWLSVFPVSTVRCIRNNYDVSMYRNVVKDDLRDTDAHRVHLWIDGSEEALVDAMRASLAAPSLMAEALMWYCQVDPQPGADEDEIDTDEDRADMLASLDTGLVDDLDNGFFAG